MPSWWWAVAAWWLVAAPVRSQGEGPKPAVEEYVVVVDLGSTGSRAFVYEFVEDTVHGNKGKKVTPGISSFSGKDVQFDEYFRPLIDHSKGLVPEEQWAQTPIFLRATAGMRLLPEAEQERLFAGAFASLSGESNPFQVARSHLGTISGEDEGYYGALSVNFLAKRIGRNLRSLVAEEEMPQGGAATSVVDVSPDGTVAPLGPALAPVMGALDLGGSSTQIVFQPLSWLDCTSAQGAQFQEESAAGCPANATLHDGVLDDEDLFVHSFLSYGVDRVRERLWTHLIEASPSSSSLVANPCGFHGRMETWQARELAGSGDATACSQLLREVLFPECSALAGKDGGKQPAETAVEANAWCPLDGVKHTPPVRGVPFVAMSVFFFAIDCMREITAPVMDLSSWPSPTIHEVLAAAQTFCSLPWTDIQASAAHPWTWEDQLPHRCFEAVYIAVVLRDAYGFDPDTRNITFALEVGGMEVEWTLGYALAAMAGGGGGEGGRGGSGQ